MQLSHHSAPEDMIIGTDPVDTEYNDFRIQVCQKADKMSNAICASACRQYTLTKSVSVFHLLSELSR